MTERNEKVKRPRAYDPRWIVLVWGVLGFFLTHPALAPDEPVSALKHFGFAGVFAVFVLFLDLLGRRLIDQFRDFWSHVPPLFMGQVAAMILIWPIYGIGLLRPHGAPWVCLGIVATTVALLLAEPSRAEGWQGFSRPRRFEWMPVALLLAIIGVRFVEALKLHPHGDPFLYHLYGPRTWFDDGGFGRFRLNWFFFHTGWFENFIQWANILLAGEPGTGLTFVQRFSQLLNVVFAYGIGASCLSSLFSDVPFRRRALIVACALVTPSFVWGVNYAKSDWMLTTWFLVCVDQISRFEKVKEKRTDVFVGFLLGAVLISKLSNLPLVVVAGLTAISIRRRSAPGLILGGVLGIGPFLLRNTLLTGNPVFPWFDIAFGFSNLGPSSQSIMGTSMVQASRSVSAQMGYWFELMSEAKLAPFALIGLVIVAIRGRSYDTRRFRIGVICFLATAWFFVQLRASTQIRYLGAGLILWNALGAYYLLWGSEMISRAWRLALPRWVAHAIVFAVIFFFSHLPLYVLFAWGPKHFQIDQIALLKHRGGEAKAFLRKNVRNGEPVLSIADNQLYYVSGLPITEAVLNPDVDRKLYPLEDPTELDRAFREMGFKWLYLEVADIEPNWFRKLEKLEKFYREKCAQSVRFDQNRTLVIDLASCSVSAKR